MYVLNAQHTKPESTCVLSIVLVHDLYLVHRKYLADKSTSSLCLKWTRSDRSDHHLVQLSVTPLKCIVSWL